MNFEGTNEFRLAHALLGALLNYELRTGATIQNRWGGGFEAMTFSPESKQFEKVGDILHTFWNASEGSSAIELFPTFYKTTYWQDALVIRSASLEVSSGAKLKTNDVTLIPPLLASVGDYDLDELGQVDFSYRAVCCHVMIQKPSGRDLMFLIDQKEEGQDVALTLSGEGRLEITDYLPNAIREQLRLRG